MNQTRGIADPRPSTAEMKERLEMELTGRSRAGFTLLLLFDLAIGAVIASLLLTEEGLPPRTVVAFSTMLVISLVWAVFFLRTLSRKKLFLAGHRLAAARLSVTFTSLFTIGAAVLAMVDEGVRSPGLAAAGFGILMLSVAIALLIRARRRVSDLTSRRNQLQHQISMRSGAPGVALAVCLVVSLFVHGGEPALAQPLSPNPFEAIVSVSPVPVRALGRDHLVYELHLTNFGEQTHRLVALSVLDESDTQLSLWGSDELAARTANIGARGGSSRDASLFRAGERKVLHLWITLAPGAKRPGLLKHRLTTSAEGGATSEVLNVPDVVVRGEALLLEAAPVSPGRWLSVRGPSNTSGHRRSLVPLDGSVRVPQRFAVDWAKIGADGRLFEENGQQNEEWYGYDLPVLAVLPGRVVKIVDGIEENAPFSPPADAVLNRDNAAGNMVIVDAGANRFVIYAHLRAGSIRVKAGELVAASDELGRIGNSGHSLAPHLHFHIADRADALASEGMPFVMPRFLLMGRIDALVGLLKGEAWTPDENRPSRSVAGEMPLENMVINLE